MQKRIGFLIIMLFIITIIFSSCGRKYKYIYQKKFNTDTTYIYTNNFEKFVLKTNDVLHINVITTNEELSKQFKLEKGSSSMNNNGGNGNNFYLTGFTIDENGDIDIPVVGKIKIAGKTFLEAKIIIRDKINSLILDAIVNIKLVSFKITVLGEVNTPGPIFIFQERVHILEVLARCGGASNYGDLRKIRIMRETKTGHKIYSLNLTKPELLNEDKFYLHPNDVLIIDPVPAKTLQLNIKDYMYFISVFSTSLSTIFLILQLKSN